MLIVLTSLTTSRVPQLLYPQCNTLLCSCSKETEDRTVRGHADFEDCSYEEMPTMYVNVTINA